MDISRRVRERVADGKVEPAIERLLADPEVRYIHVRNTEAGCFIARVERDGIVARAPSKSLGGGAVIAGLSRALEGVFS